MRAKPRTMTAAAPEVARAHRGVLATGTLAVVLVAHDDPAQLARLVVARDLRDVPRRSRPSPRFLVVPGSPPERAVGARGTCCPRCDPGGRGSGARARPGEMWSVVHLPFALRSSGSSHEVLAVPPHRTVSAPAGAPSRAPPDLHDATASSVGGRKPFSSGRKPLAGSSSPVGGSSLNSSPSAPSSVSVERVELHPSRPAPWPSRSPGCR